MSGKNHSVSLPYLLATKMDQSDIMLRFLSVIAAVSESETRWPRKNDWFRVPGVRWRLCHHLLDIVPRNNRLRLDGRMLQGWGCLWVIQNTTAVLLSIAKLRAPALCSLPICTYRHIHQHTSRGNSNISNGCPRRGSCCTPTSTPPPELPGHIPWHQRQAD